MPTSHDRARTDDDLRSTHTPEAVRHRLSEGPRTSYLRDFVYGGIDGVVTTFAVVSGVAGAQLDVRIIIVLGIANLVGDGFSMAVSNYLGTRAEEQVIDRARQTEEHHVRHIPEGEREEIRQIFAAKGFEGDDLQRVVDVITADDKQWVDTMLKEEHGLSLSGPSPWRAAAMTFGAFIIIGALPLLPFVLDLIAPDLNLTAFLASTAMTAIAFFTVGALKSRFVDESWWRAGTETTVVGGLAAALAYLAGYLLRGVV